MSKFRVTCKMRRDQISGLDSESSDDDSRDETEYAFVYEVKKGGSSSPFPDNPLMVMREVKRYLLSDKGHRLGQYLSKNYEIKRIEEVN
jgi:hypothetical protein